LPLVVRSWNLFHGNCHPPERLAHVEAAVRMASEDEPAILCLQEVPGWALAEVGSWSGMRACADLAARPAFGPFPWTAGLGKLVTSLHPGRLRSAFAGQGNAILLREDMRVLGRELLTLNSRRFRRAQARWLRLPPIARLAWAKERRICQTVRLALPDGRTALVANLHATAYRPDDRLADAELLRAAVFADGIAEPDDIVVLAGDFNVRPSRSRTLADLSSPEWGFSKPGPGIDHLLVRGASSSLHRVWPAESRLLGGCLVSDHAPVEVVVE